MYQETADSLSKHQSDTDYFGNTYDKVTSSELLQIRKNRLEARKIELEQELITINAQLHNIGKL